MSVNYNQLPASSYSFSLLRLIEQYKTHDRLIIAFDIDDTVRPYHSKSCGSTESLIRMARDILNPYLIVYTSNPDIEGAKKFLDKNEIPYDAINEGAPFVDYHGGKSYYNILLDDKAGLAQAEGTLRDLIALVVNGIVKKEDKDVL